MLAINNVVPILYDLEERRVTVPQVESVLYRLIELEKKSSYQQGYEKGYAHGEYDCKSRIIDHFDREVMVVR